MDFSQILTLSLVQGLTEFLPISSSAHLILAPRFFGFEDQGLAFDVAVHFGTLSAVLIYFRGELQRIARAWLASLLPQNRTDDDAKMGWLLILATLPVVFAGLLFKDLIENELRAVWVIATTTLLFGLLLWYYDVRGAKNRQQRQIGWRDALIIGLFQAIALIPGTSRSGITITAGLMIGLTRTAAARFSFLLAIPTILASASLTSLQLFDEQHPLNWPDLALGIGCSFLAAYLCIHYFLRLIERIGMLPFVVYRVLLSLLLGWIVWA